MHTASNELGVVPSNVLVWAKPHLALGVGLNSGGRLKVKLSLVGLHSLGSDHIRIIFYYLP
jgi:hypothetical protein